MKNPEKQHGCRGSFDEKKSAMYLMTKKAIPPKTRVAEALSMKRRVRSH